MDIYDLGKNHRNHTIAALKFNGLLSYNYYKMQSNDEYNYEYCWFSVKLGWVAIHGRLVKVRGVNWS